MIHRLMSAYDDNDFILKTKARYLLWFLIIALPIMTILAVTMFLINRDDKAFATIPGVGIGWLFSAWVFYSIRAGKYQTASYVFAGVFNIVVALLTINEARTMPSLAMSGVSWFSLVCIVSTVLFCPRRVVIAAALVHLLARTVTFISAAGSASADMNSLSTNFGDGVVVIILVTIIAMLTVKMLSGSSEKIKVLLGVRDKENTTLTEILETVFRSSSVLEKQANGMFSMAQKFSDDILSQAASTEEASATMEELSASSQSIASKSSMQQTTLESAYQKVEELSASIQETGILMEKAITARESANKLIEAMKKLMDRAINNMHDATMSAASMQSFTDIIKSISDNISLLSLNAAIEAARAGETGRGFAVVADQVGRLSEQTLEQTNSITEHANQLELVMREAGQSLAEAMEAMQKVIGHVAAFGEHVGEVALRSHIIIETNRIIKEEILQIKNNAEEITVATTEQKTAAEEVTGTIERINISSQYISSATQDIIQDADRLLQLASELSSKSLEKYKKE